MGRPVVNKGRRSVTLKSTSINSYKKLVALAATVSAKMGAAAATFASPLPVLADLDTAAATLVTAAQPQGLKRNKGSKSATLAAQAAANDTRNLLSQLVQYAYNTVLDLFPEDSHQFNAVLSTSGFSMKNIRKPKHISASRWVRQNNSAKFPASAMHLNWRRPKGLIKGAPIAGYLIKAARAFRRLQTAGYQDVIYSAFTPTDPTGLLPASQVFDFKVVVDGGAPQAISVLASGAPKMQDIVTIINSQLVGATCLALDLVTNNHFRIQSSSLGVLSSVVISGTVNPYLWSNVNGYITEGVPVTGTDALVPIVDSIIASVTKTNFTYNPSMLPIEELIGSIVPFNARGEGNPINFKMYYII